MRVACLGIARTKAVHPLLFLDSVRILDVFFGGGSFPHYRVDLV